MVSDGPGADDPDDTDARPSPRQDPSSIRDRAANAPAGPEPAAAERVPGPTAPPAPPAPPVPVRDRPVFVVAARRAEVDEEVDEEGEGPLFIVPAVQPSPPAQPPPPAQTPAQVPPTQPAPAPAPTPQPA